MVTAQTVVFGGLSLFPGDLESEGSLQKTTVRSSISTLQTPLGGGGSNDLEQQQNDDDQKDQANAAATVVTNSRAQAIATKSENEKQDNTNDQHIFSFAE